MNKPKRTRRSAGKTAPRCSELLPHMPNARLDDMLAEILAHDLAESRLRTMALQIIHILAEQNCHCGIKAITDSALHAERAISAPNAGGQHER